MAAGAGLGALAALEVEGLALLHLVHGVAEAGRGQLVQVAGVGGLLLRQHAALAGADAGAGHLGTHGQGHLGLFGEGAEAHVRDEQRTLQHQGFVRIGADDHLGADRVFVQQRHLVQLGGQELDLFPLGQLVARHAHGADPAMVTDLGQPVFGQVLDVLIVRLLRPAVVILVESLVGLAIVGLGIVQRPGADLVLIHPDLVAFHPGAEAVELFRGIVGADAGLVAVVPVVKATDDISALDAAVGHQGTAVRAAAVEHRDLLLVRPADENQIHAGGQGIGGFQRFDGRPRGQRDLIHCSVLDNISLSIRAGETPTRDHIGFRSLESGGIENGEAHRFVDSGAIDPNNVLLISIGDIRTAGVSDLCSFVLIA